MSRVFDRAAARFTVTPDRPHCTNLGCTAWGSEVRAVRTTHGQYLPTLVQ